MKQLEALNDQILRNMMNKILTKSHHAEIKLLRLVQYVSHNSVSHNSVIAVNFVFLHIMSSHCCGVSFVWFILVLLSW